jgi:stalled ribosome rescue protein Dom34
MNHAYHAIVWIDHREAKVCRFSANDDAEVQINAHTSLQRLHHRHGGWEAGGNPPQDTEFFRRIAATLHHIAGIVVAGPGNAKSAFKKFLDDLHPDVASHVFAVETADHGDQALLALGRGYFHLNDTPAPGAAPKGRPA